MLAPGYHLRQDSLTMSARRLLLAFVVFLLISLTSLWSKWNGSFGLHAGYPIENWNVTCNGSVQGWPAFIGIVALLVAIVLLIWASVRFLAE
jgi:hypothetical protein